ncbi:hypothetical protein [Psychrobacillus lasiicapitis]|uniref:Apea-like HEPN domain-containing protein n=2 Tax=Psychrobacillus lasiicapitis TaxID=1636719 RepID=A0A544SZT0_9BACI|nr:hypothetical protein [Psychrobacillus lasiicapitis]TQR10711.1 hypothetical protein FG382_16735 [Psychrobacillus lasiicapitis]GGA43155.1 hypothetical protein GCM10011384_36160 [Psychrobacillus lasiicapitis]
MGIKLWAKIKLPYILRLENEEKYEIELPSDEEFSLFRVSFFPNSDNPDNSNYLSEYREKSCNYIEIESIVKRFNYSDYPVRNSVIYNSYEVSEIDTTEIFKLVKNKLNIFLIELSKITKMFWITDISLNPISGVIGNRTDYTFVEPDTAISDNIRSYYTINDNYMEEVKRKEVKPINMDILSVFRNENSLILKPIWHNYLNKATKAMYSSENEEFIIYCAISAESFIKQLIKVNSNLKEKDIVLEKLTEVGKNQMVNTYFKIILKYLFGANLIDKEEVLHKNLLDIFTLRNEIMHKGYLDKSSFEKVGINELNFEQANLYLSRLHRAIEICLNLFAKNPIK